MERLAKLEKENARLREENALLQNENSRLKQQLASAHKNSSTSSKPPSSDIVKPKKSPTKGGKKRKRGGQPGHPRHERSKFPPEMIDEFFSYTLDSCPDCGSNGSPRRTGVATGRGPASRRHIGQNPAQRDSASPAKTGGSLSRVSSVDVNFGP